MNINENRINSKARVIPKEVATTSGTTDGPVSRKTELIVKKAGPTAYH